MYFKIVMDYLYNKIYHLSQVIKELLEGEVMIRKGRVLLIILIVWEEINK